MRKPTVPEVLPLVDAVYLQRDGGAGHCLHVVLDDGNIDCVEYALEIAQERGCKICEAAGEKMLLMSKTQINKLCAMSGQQAALERRKGVL